MKKWSDLTKEERARVIQWLRQDVAGEAVDQELRDAAAEELAFLPLLGVFVDDVEESIVSAILGDAPSSHWAIGEEVMAPVSERAAFESMEPALDGGPIRW